MTKIKNEMVYTNTDNYKGYGLVSEISTWSKHIDDCGHKENIKDIRLWNKMAKALYVHNPDICGQWKTLYQDDSTHNHITQFVNNIFRKLRSGILSLDNLGKIEALDDGSRGLAATSQMHLYDTTGNILDVDNIIRNKYCNF